MFEQCPQCGNLLTTIDEIDTGICASCGAHVDDDEDDLDDDDGIYDVD